MDVRVARLGIPGNMCLLETIMKAPILIVCSTRVASLHLEYNAVPLETPPQYSYKVNVHLIIHPGCDAVPSEARSKSQAG